MKRESIKMKKRSGLGLILLLLSLLLVGCGGKGGQETAGESKEKQLSGKAEGYTEEELEALCGEWSAVYGLFTSYEEDGEKTEQFSMASDDSMAENDLVLYTEDGALYADYRDSVMTCYHLSMERVKEKLYEGYEGYDWYLVAKPGRWEEVPLRFGLNDKGELLRFNAGEEEGDRWEYQSLFVKNDSENSKKTEAYRYARVVTVSTAEELAAAIGNRTKIILKPGAYDITALTAAGTTGKVSESYDTVIDVPGFYLDGIENLCIEAESGELTELYITDSARPVLPIYNSGHIKFSGITFGHRIEPGYCSGSVIYLSGASNIDIEGCKLYGCGSYGVEADGASDLRFKGSAIYGCTYGIMYLRNVYYLDAADCDFYDNSGYEMLDFYQSSGIHFRDCRFRNNGSKDHAFMRLAKCWGVEIDKCKFDDNLYAKFADNDAEEDESESSLTIENTVFHDGN